MRSLRWVLVSVLTVLIPTTVLAIGPVLDVNTCGLKWDAPQVNTDGSNLTDLSKYRVYIGVSPGVKKGGTPTAEVTVTTPDPPTGATSVWICVGLSFGQKYAVVTAVDVDGNESTESNEVPFVYASIPTSPPNLRIGTQ